MSYDLVEPRIDRDWMVKNENGSSRAHPPTMGDAHHPFHHSGSFLRVPGKGTKDIRRNEELSPFTVADLGSTAK